MFQQLTSDHLPGIGEEADLSVSDEEDDQEGDLSSDDGMELSPRTKWIRCWLGKTRDREE